MPKALILGHNGANKGSLDFLAEGLRGAAWDVVEVRRGEAGWQDETCRLVKDERPDYFFAFSRIYDHERRVLHALQDGHIRTLFLDCGIGIADGHYGTAVFDPIGENAVSSIAWGGFDRSMKNVVQRQAAQVEMSCIEELSGRIAEMAGRAKVPDCIPPEFLFLCLQRTADKVLIFDSVFPFPEELAAQFAEVVGARGVIKPHPSDTQFSWSNHTGAMLIERGDLSPESQDLTAWLIANCKRMVVVNSTTAYLRMALGGSVAMLGRGWASGNRVAIEARNIEEAVTEGVEGEGVAKLNPERQKQFVAFMMSRQWPKDNLSDPKKVVEIIRFFHEATEWEPYSTRQCYFAPSCRAAVEPDKNGCGYLYVAMGERYWSAFVESARSLRAVEPDAQIAVVTNCEWAAIAPAVTELGLQKEHVIVVNYGDGENRMVKTRLNTYTPFARTIYLDADTTVTAPLRELFRHLDSFDLCMTHDPYYPTVGERVKWMKLVREEDRREMLAVCGPDATMPQWGFFAFRKSGATDGFFDSANKQWLRMGSVGDSAAFTIALWESGVKVEYLLPSVWQGRAEDESAKIRHRFGSMGRAIPFREVADFHEEWANRGRLPIITTIYIPDPQNQRYPDTDGLIRRCMNESFRGKRFVMADKAPDQFLEWCRRRGDSVHVLADGKPPRMNLLLQSALKHVETDIFWTVEQDVIISAETERAAETLFRTLPQRVAAMFLQPVGEDGKPCHPWARFSAHSHSRVANGLEVYVTPYSPFLATIWRTAALKSVDLATLPALHLCDIELAKILRRQKWILCGNRKLRCLHYKQSSYRRKETSGKD